MRVDLAGKIFGRLHVLEPHDASTWACICECGEFYGVTTEPLLYGWAKSCGCRQAPRVQIAQALYDLCPTVKPEWNQLGDTTKSVWKQRALAMQEFLET